jgi:hypothetical protein
MYRSLHLAGSRQRTRRPLSSLAQSALASLGVTLAAISAGVQGASAQEAASPWQAQLLVTPYLWLSGIYGTIQTPMAQASTVNVNVGPGQVLEDLTGAPFMGSAEVPLWADRSGRRHAAHGARNQHLYP